MQRSRQSIRYLALTAAVLQTSLAYATSPDDLMVRNRASLDQGTFEFDVKDAGRSGANIEIRCIAECGAHVPTYSENTGFAPVYVMRPKDDSPRFVSLWTSGSAYRVMVHQVGAHKTEKLLEEGTRDPPVVSLDKQGNERMTLCDEGKGCRVLQWTGGRYVVKPNP